MLELMNGCGLLSLSTQQGGVRAFFLNWFSSAVTSGVCGVFLCVSGFSQRPLCDLNW